MAFKMLRNNVSRLIAQLDDVRKNPKKFVCLNDNIDYRQDTARTVKLILRDFYDSVLPIPSQFELPRNYRNKFLHVDELKQWWFVRRHVKVAMQGVVVVLALFAVFSFLFDKIDTMRRRFVR